jgi:hypothetical protein
MKNSKKKTGKRDTPIKSMEEFQKKYLPSLVGKKCPYCGKDITDVRKVCSWNTKT